MNSFNNLSTVKFQEKMKPAAARIYKSIFPNCRVEDLRSDGFKVHVLDQEFAIDSLLHLDGGQWFSIQEKYRDYPKWGFHDFTQELKNGDGTPGEWSKLGAQLYFYGWCDPSKSVFLEWFIMDVVKYKILIERGGGIYHVGNVRQNKQHGSATFAGVPYEIIKPAILYSGSGNVYYKRVDCFSFSNPKILGG